MQTQVIDLIDVDDENSTSSWASFTNEPIV